MHNLLNCSKKKKKKCYQTFYALLITFRDILITIENYLDWLCEHKQKPNCSGIYGAKCLLKLSKLFSVIAFHRCACIYNADLYLKF